MTKTPSWSARFWKVSTRNPPTATRQIAELNSYMLPHGIRMTPMPRLTTSTAWISQPTMVSPSAAVPNVSRRERGGSDTATGGSGVDATGAPAPTRARSAGAAIEALVATMPRRANARSAMKANIAAT